MPLIILSTAAARCLVKIAYAMHVEPEIILVKVGLKEFRLDTDCIEAFWRETQLGNDVT